MLAKLFSLEDKTINYSQEFIGGIINFMAIAYIIAVNPMILHAGGLGFPLMPAVTATVLVIIAMTILAGLIVKLPFVIAPGMGINAIIAYSLILHDKIAVPNILGIILFSSIFLLIFSVTRIRQLIIHAIPKPLQIALGSGIGVFLIIIGCKNVGLIVANPNTIIGLNHLNLQILLCFGGFLLAAILFLRGKIYALILPLLLITVINIFLTNTKLPAHYLAMPDFSLFGQIEVFSTLKLSLLPSILAIFVVSFFDTTSATIGLISQTKFDSDRLKHKYIKRALIADSAGGIISSIVGSSPGVICVESSAAIQNGARTGFASLITALCCVPFIFTAPLISMIPSAATSPILILVGMLMLGNLRQIKLTGLEDLIAVILTIIMMPLAFSITAGAVFGIMSYTILKLALGKFKEISPTLAIVAFCCSVWFFVR